jgi:hypothetical protein
MNIEDKAYFAKAIETLYSNWIISEKMGTQYVNGGNGSVKEAIEDAKRWIDIWSKKYDFGKLTVNIYKVENKIPTLIKTIKFAHQGTKAKFYLDPSNIPLILKQHENENRKVSQLVKQKQASNKKSDLMDATGLAHGMAYSNATANTIQDLRKISKSKNPADKQAAQQALSKIEAIESFWQSKHTELQNQYRAAHSRQGIKESSNMKIEDKRYFGLQDSGADDKALKNSVALEIQEEIKNLKNIMAEKERDLKSKGWDINWEGLPAKADRAKRQVRDLFIQLGHLTFLKGLLQQGSSPADIKKDLIKAVQKIKKVAQ